MKSETISKRKDKTMYLIEKIYRIDIIEKIMPNLSKTFITPNIITIFNLIFGLLVIYMAYKGKFMITAIGYQIYELLDHLDGSLARYKNMTSKLGARLDVIGDSIFYNLIYIAIGFGRIDYIIILGVILSINIYSVITTFYIVPKLRMLKKIERRGIKRWFLDRGYIIGMDLTLLGAITSIGLVISKLEVMYIVIIILYIFDIIYRIHELNLNLKIEDNIKEMK